MKLLTKFNLIFIVVFGAGLALASWLAHNFLHDRARQEILERARLMMQTTLATRDYTTTEIKPLLIKRERSSDHFLPQTVPAFAATEVFRDLQKHYPDYSYKEATLNPTNLRDRAVDWEADVINQFRNHKVSKELIGERDTPSGKSLYLARPLTISDPACLECHDTARRAPRAVVDQYGPNNGFGWKLNETVGAQIVSVPESLVIATADRALTGLVIDLGILSLFTLVSLDLLLIFAVVRPVSRLSRTADEISRGNMDVEELPVRGRDEISILATSFNRMQRSLQRAMKLLSSEDDSPVSGGQE
jgi:HAMP domain-containing protein